jgi:uncharacterized membrane protein
MLNDLSSILIWWSTIFGLSILSLPVILTLFSKFWDNGYTFAKTLSLIVITYLILILGIFKILPFNAFGLTFLILSYIVFDILFLFHQKRYLNFFKILKTKYRLFIAEELIFLIILVLWSFIRGFAPSIEGLEKYMDWGFVNSSLRSHFLPPQDMWFSGEVINYYYFGHLIFALITKISQISSSITYNLSIATVCALTFISTFSLSSNLVFLSLTKKSRTKYIIAGIVSALLLTFGGNLHSVYKIAKLNYSQNNNHFTLTQTAINKSIDSYWYPDATRFIGHDPDTNDKTIHEFPLYSFVVADLHGHMNDIFITLFFLSFLLVSFIEIKEELNWKFIIFSGFILSLCYMTNAWDFAIYGLLLAIFTILINFHYSGLKSLVSTFFSGGLVILFWYLFSLPFSLNFIPMMEGIKISDGHSPFYQLFVLYGGFWLICLPFVIRLFIIIIKNYRLKIKNSFLCSDIFIAALIITGTLLILIPEIVYIKDIYIYEHRRANTMFKLVYQSFILYSLVSGYVLVRLPQLLKSKFIIRLYKIIFAFVFVIHLIYPYFAIKSYYGDLKYYQGLDGFKYLQPLYPDNYQAILWINKNISGQPVMLEAVGDSYTTFNQVSSATGLPTVQGWIVHEWLWRGGYDAPAARQIDVEKIYLSKDLEETKNLLNQYQVKYIFVGDKEYEKYPSLDPKKFETIGAKAIFQSGKTIVYQL